MDIYEQKFGQDTLEFEEEIDEDKIGLALEEEEEIKGETWNDIENLLFVGKLEESLEVLGHKVQLKTLTVNEELKVYSMIKDHMDGPAGQQGRAFATGILAAAITSIDDRPLASPLSPKDDGLLRSYQVLKDYYWPVIEKIWRKYLDLEERQKEALRSLEGKS